MAPLSAVVIGAGQRGSGYASYAHYYPEELKIVGVAEPRKHIRDSFQQKHAIKEKRVFDTWEKLAAEEKMADIAIITTQDQMHKDPTVALANKGYHILVEKPMAVKYEDCVEMIDAVEKNGVMFGVCHVLRYYPLYTLLKKLISENVIGQICHISHTEPVGFWHYAHSYVRGNWRNEKESSSSLLAKCCHDLDLITYWMGDNRCEKISSFGSLMHFTKENKPEGAADRCVDCKLKNNCAFSAQRIYGHRSGWPTSVVTAGDVEDLDTALRTGPYGRCVYDCDNDVMSNQVVNMQFKDGATASLNMVALTKKLCARETFISGTKGEIRCDFSKPIEVFDFLTQQTSLHIPEKEFIPPGLGGHGGADFYMIKRFVDAIKSNKQDLILAGPRETLNSHNLVFAAERSRVQGKTIEL